jgi:hypothetical protein
MVRYITFFVGSKRDLDCGIEVFVTVIETALAAFDHDTVVTASAI